MGRSGTTYGKSGRELSEGKGGGKSRCRCSTCPREVFIIIYTIGTGAGAKAGGGMCRGGDAYYSIANIMILTVEKRGAHKGKDGYGYEEMD